LISQQVLVPYSLDRPLRLTADASPVGAGCVLAHVREDGKEEPIAFASKSFSERELRYPVHEREAAALIFGLKKFNKYLCAREFEIVTDNKPIAAIFAARSEARPLATPRLQRWGLLLSAHRYKILYRKSELFPHADFLSRYPCPDTTPVEAEVYNVSYVDSGLLSAQDVATETLADPILRKVLVNIKDGWPDQVEADLQVYARKFLQLTTEGNCILWNSRVVVHPSLRRTVLSLLHGTHPGVSRMKTLARSYVWWPGMDQCLEELVKNCGVCQALQSATPRGLVPWSSPMRRWQRVYMDFAVFEGHNLLVLQDGHSKWPEVKILAHTDASSLIETLRTLFAAYGLPEEVVSDNGQPFASEQLAKFFKLNAVVHTFTPTYHPQSNGSAERTVRSVKEGLLQQLLDSGLCKRSLQHKIDAWIFDYRNTPHTTTGVSPVELFLGRRPRTLLSLLQPSNLLKWKMQEVKEKRMTTDRAKVTVFQVGDLMWVRSVTHRRLNWLPGVIEGAVSSVSYRVICNTRVRQVSSSHLRRRSEGAACLEVDPAAVDVEHLASDQGPPPPGLTRPPLWKTLSAPLRPAPEPVPQVILNGGAQATQGELPSPQESEVPNPRAVQMPSPVARSPLQRQEPSDVRMPVPVSSSTRATPGRPLVSRQGRLIIPPKARRDYVP
jgi:hypothetical protein